MIPEQYRAVRLKLELTQPELAEILCVQRETISRRENGKDTITREASMALEGFYKLETGSFSLPSVKAAHTSEGHKQSEIWKTTTGIYRGKKTNSVISAV